MGSVRQKADKSKPFLKAIKDFLPEDNQLIQKIAYENKITQAEAIHIVCEFYKKTETKNLPELNNTEALNELTQNYYLLKQENNELFNQNNQLTLQLEELINKGSQEINEENKIELTGTQFICEPSEKLANQLKKVRRFLKSKQQLDQSESPETFANKMACLAMKKYINYNYSHLL